ncbi:coiled-coil domain-containing protein 60 isoform X6 [Tursiops truncatus]|uniref:Coiled-coil domain-containing protein 60 isoform X7 n=1 Tax=Tursiops truncatus TaxID=9739 RepID=A0A6J3PS75_TURTR|nr:coiled-coil domain-containing protein 60 isoform X7 [Tursiops truncatus]
MTKVPATKKIQSSPASGALWPFYASDHLTQVPDKPMRSIKYRQKDVINLKKDLTRSRILIQWVKIGRGYFTILREESALKKKQQQLQKLKEEGRNIFQPAKKMSDVQYGDILLTANGDKKMKKVGMGVLLRPFTPVHSCIIAPSLPEAHVEPIFRQLCALHWLLEALTIDHTHHTMKPVITCWNPKDPGGSKSTIKKINKDKSMGQRWERFITAPKTKRFKVPVARITSYKPSRRGSTLSLSRTSGGSSPQSSMVSVNPGSDEPQSVITQATGSKDVEDSESSSAKPEEEPLHVNLQKLLEMVREDAQRTVTMADGMQKQAASIFSTLRQNKSDSAYKDMQTTRKSSDRSSSTSGDSHSQVPQKKSKRYFDLLSKLPEDLKNFRPAKKILAKLQKFGENLDLRIRPHVLLKVLQDMRVWELCSPDIAVAVEFVREHVIHMPHEEYISWLQDRVNVPIRPHSAQT